MSNSTVSIASANLSAFIKECLDNPQWVKDKFLGLGIDLVGLTIEQLNSLSEAEQKAINAGTSEHEQIKELVNAPIKPKKEATPLLPELKQAAREEVAKRKNGGYYPFNAFLSKDTRSLLDSPVGEGSRHAYLYKLSIRIHQAKNACEEFGIPIEPGEPEALFRFAVGNNIEGDYPEWEAERDWEQGASKAEQYPYPGGEERLLRITGWIDEIDGFGVPTEIIEDEDSEKSEEQIKAERKKRDFKYWTELNALDEYKGKNVNYTHTIFDLHCYKQETKKLIRPGVVNVLIAKPGLGKSELARDIGLESNSVLALSPLTSLSKKFASVEWQLDYKDREIKHSNPEAAIFREVHTYKTFTWYSEHVLAQSKALIFFDEFVQGIKQVLGTKGRGIFQPWERQAWITHFKNLVETAARSGNTIIIASNDITDIYIEFIRQNISDDIEINVIINDYIPNRPPIKFYTDQKPEGFLLKHEQALAKTWNAQTNNPDGCVLFFSDHKGGRKGSSINAKSIKKKHPKWSNFILDANRDTKEDEPVQFFFVDPNSEIIKYLAVLFSNVVVNGISMTNGWANSIYCLVNGIDSPEDVHQKILRERTAQDINIWVADRNTQGTDCPYVNWQHVRSFRIKRYKQNSAIQRDALNGLGIKFDVPSQEYKSSPAIDLSCKITALENLKNRHLREYTKLYLEQSGYTVQEVNTEFTKPEEEGKKFQNDVVIFEQDYSEALATDNAEDLEAEAVEACKDDPAYRYAIAKYFLKKKYPPNFIEGYGGIEITNPETGDKIKLEGLAGIAWLENKLKLANKFDRGYMVLFAKDIAPVVEDLKNEASILKDYKFNNVKRELMPDDHSTLSLEITTLRSLNLGELIDKLEPGTSLDENSKAVEEFCSKVKALNTKQSLNVTVKPNARPKDILNKIIEGKLGLPIESERKRQGKAQPYLYYIKPEYLAWFYLFCECKQAERKSEYRLEYLVEQVANP